MQVFVYEYITGGGLFSSRDPDATPSGSLFVEGAAMACAAMADFAAIDGVRVVAMRDARLRNLLLPAHTLLEIGDAQTEISMLERCAAEADWSLLIAPEFDRILEERVRLVERSGGRLLSPDGDFVALASDKHRTALHLHAAGAPTPSGVVWSPPALLPELDYPLVAKPRDGAGSMDVRRIDSASDLRGLAAEPARSWRLERYLPGQAASVAMICGPNGAIPLPAMRQNLSGDGRFTYLGGAGPLAGALSFRAQRLAQLAVAALPATRGYVGVDLVLGHSSTSDGDAIIEINPRLTTSYVGLRKLTKTNLAAAMLAAVQGEELELSFRSGLVEFSAGGGVRIDEAAAFD